MANEITAEQVAASVARIRVFADACRQGGGPAKVEFSNKEVGNEFVADLDAILATLARLQGLEARVKGAFIGYSEEDRGYMRAHRFVVGVPDSIGAGRRVALLALDGEGVGS